MAMGITQASGSVTFGTSPKGLREAAPLAIGFPAPPLAVTFQTRILGDGRWFQILKSCRPRHRRCSPLTALQRIGCFQVVRFVELIHPMGLR